MAKNKERDTERRAVADQMRKEQARKERQRSMLILGGAVVVVIGLLAAAIIPYMRQVRADNRAAGTPISDLGVKESAAGCEPVSKVKATGNNDHVNPPQKIDYPQTPPSSGPHWGNFLQGSEIRTFYSTNDRPEVERLVHSLEHGHTILWYDDTVKPGTEAYTTIKAMAGKFDRSGYFMAAPWMESDGGSFPDGKHIALTHWTGPEDQEGVTQLCSEPSGAVVKKFTEAYPSSNTPEPGAP